MAGLVPAIHAFQLKAAGKTWMPATIPGSSPGTGMTRGDSISSEYALQISSDAQSLESVLGLVIHGAAGAFRGPRRIKLGNDLVDRARLGRDRKRDVGIAKRAIALAVLGEVEWNDRYPLTPRIGPDVGFGPMEDRMDAQMRASRQPGVEVIPEFRRLIAHVPMALKAARREHPLLGASRFLVAANAGEQAIEAMFGKGKLQPLGLARSRPRGRRQRGVDGFDRRAR